MKPDVTLCGNICIKSFGSFGRKDKVSYKKNKNNGYKIKYCHQKYKEYNNHNNIDMN